MIEKLPWNAGDDSKLMQFLSSVTQVVTQLRIDDITIIPAGWLSAKSRHLILCVLAKKQNGFTLTVCNTGDGLEYHAAGVDPNTSHDTKGMMMVIDNIPDHKLSDSAFWFFTSRMLTYMHPKNKAKTFYQKLLPYLNDKPLKANIQSYDFHMPMPHGRDRRLLHCVLLAVSRGFIEKGLSVVRTVVVHLS